MKKIIPVILAVSLLAGCKLPGWLKKENEEKQSVNQTYHITVPVTTSPAIRGTLVKHIKTNGVAEASRTAEVVAEVSGTIKEIRLEENSMATGGNIILEIDKQRLQLDLDQAQLNLEKAQAEFNAWKKLGNGSDEKQLKLQTGLTEAEITLNKLRMDLDKASVKVPFDGVVADLNLTTGQQVSVGQKLFSVYNLDHILVRARVLESEVTRIRIGNETVIRFPSIKDRLYHGKVESIAPAINKTTRTCEILVKIKNDGLIKDGMFADVRIDTEKYDDRIMIYKDALLVRDGKKLVFAVEDGKAKWQYVTLGEENEKFVEITEGVQPDQSIVIDGNFSLSHDASVEIAETVSYEEIQKRF